MKLVVLVVLESVPRAPSMVSEFPELSTAEMTAPLFDASALEEVVDEVSVTFSKAEVVMVRVIPSIRTNGEWISITELDVREMLVNVNVPPLPDITPDSTIDPAVAFSWN